MRRVFLSFLLYLCLASSSGEAFIRGGYVGSSGALTPTWRTLPVGGGGFMRGLDIVQSDGSLLARSDTPPALYRFDTTANAWVAILTSYSIPSAFNGDLGYNANFAEGVWEARIAPSNTSIFYMIYKNVPFVSTNKGALWTEINTGWPIDSFGANSGDAQFGYRVAVDPANANIVYAGTPAHGLYKTINGGTSWALVSGTPPTASTSVGMAITFDPTSPVVSNVTQGIFVASTGQGVWHSTNGGTTWTKLNTTNMPVNFARMTIDQNGKLYIVDGSNIYSWTSGGGWSINASNDSPSAIAIDPSSASNLVYVSAGGRTYISTNGGTSWTTAGPITTTYDGSGDATWINKGPIAGYQGPVESGGPSPGSYTLSTGNLLFDSSSVLYYNHGFGILKALTPFATPNTAITYANFSRGLEALDATSIIHPPNGAPIGTAWDLPVWNFPNYISSPTAYPTYYGPDDDFYSLMPSFGVNGVRGWWIDYSSSVPNPANLVLATAIGGYYSSNAGVNWTRFASQTPFTNAFFYSQIASSTPTNHVAFTFNTVPYFTTNNGASWTASTYAGNNYSSGAFPNISASYVAADRVTANVFYLISPADGFYLSTNSGATFTKNSSFAPSLGSNKIKAVPGKAGHVFFTNGASQNPTPITTDLLYWSTNMQSALGTQSWNTLSGFDTIFDFDFGTVVAGQSYPTIYLVARNTSTGVLGAYYCSNFNPATGSGTWVLMTNADGTEIPMGWFAPISAIAGDPNVDHAASISFTNGGFKRYNFLLKRDLDPSNDNDPMWLEKAA